MQHIVIFTVGFHARATYRALQRRLDCRVIAFVDNNRSVQGSALFDVPVLAPAALAELAYDRVALPGRNQTAIRRQLEGELHVAPDRIWEVRKSEVAPASEELERRGVSLASLLRRVTGIMDGARARYWAMHSSLLGLARGDDLAAFSDCDLGLDAVCADGLEERFRREGLQPRVQRAGNTVCQITLRAGVASAFDEPALIDLHPLHFTSDEVQWTVNAATLRLPAAHFRGHAERRYRGVPVRTPVEAEAVLTRLYGDGWRVPAETWNGAYQAPRADFPEQSPRAA